jgi:hypothetical protein
MRSWKAKQLESRAKQSRLEAKQLESKLEAKQSKAKQGKAIWKQSVPTGSGESWFGVSFCQWDASLSATRMKATWKQIKVVRNFNIMMVQVGNGTTAPENRRCALPAAGREDTAAPA